MYANIGLNYEPIDVPDGRKKSCACMQGIPQAGHKPLFWTDNLSTERTIPDRNVAEIVAEYFNFLFWLVERY
jgi:hypothetical protein